MNRQSVIEPLERRRFLAAVQPTAVEQYEVELINRARANPAAEAARFGIALNEGLAAGTISTAAKQPLAISPFVTDAARRHSKWMLDADVFSHTGSGASNPGNRIKSAGYALVPPWTWGENIGYRSQRPSVPDPAAMAKQIHQDLFVDRNIPGRGHRTNLLGDAFKEIGAGVVSGEFDGYNAVMLTTDFAASGSGSFLTGVAYDDAVTKDNFYTPGEGLGGVTITARRASDNRAFTALTWTSGGYSLNLSPGTYAVSGSGAALGGTVNYGNVTIGSKNVKVDFRPAPPPATGSIKGTVFTDLNRDGAPDAGEPVHAGVVVYIDANRNGRRDGNEKYVRTRSDGLYRFADLRAGTYRIRHYVPAGLTVLAPTNGFHDVRLTAGRAVGGRNFADVSTSN